MDPSSDEREEKHGYDYDKAAYRKSVPEKALDDEHRRGQHFYALFIIQSSGGAQMSVRTVFIGFFEFIFGVIVFSHLINTLFAMKIIPSCKFRFYVSGVNNPENAAQIRQTDMPSVN